MHNSRCTAAWIVRFTTGLCLSAVSDAAIGCQPKQTNPCDDGLRFDPAKRIYTSQCVGYAPSALPNLLDAAFASGKPVVIFVHGRGDEPGKSLAGATFVEGDAVHKLERQYGVAVLMFNWQSKAFLKDRTRPLSHMQESATALDDILSRISEYTETHDNSSHISLVTHSMGCNVLERVVRNRQQWISNKRIFEHVLLSEPDCDNIGHTSWLDTVAAVEDVFVTSNRDDIALDNSSDDRATGAKPLGLDPGPSLSARTAYLNFTNLSDKEGRRTRQHEVFNKAGMHGQVNLCQLMDEVIRGESVNLSNYVGEANAARGSVLHIKFEIAPMSTCFEGLRGSK